MDKPANTAPKSKGQKQKPRTQLGRALRAPEAELSADEAASTFFRFFRSAHVNDYRSIVKATIILLLIYCDVVIVVGYLDVLTVGTQGAGAEVAGAAETPAKTVAVQGTAATTVAIFKFLIAFIGSAIGAAGIIIAWAYQSASARLGVVDLFAAEIGTLCRVGTVLSVGQIYVEQYFAPRPPAAESGDSDGSKSQEEYFPIFNSNARELQLLEASVVSDITEFYTYMKAMRDSQRRLAAMPRPDPAEAPETASGKLVPWRRVLRNMIYMLFLGCESGRKAITRLVEFQPAAAERRIVILVTELRCYSFLLGQFGAKELHLRRLILRADDYEQEVRSLSHLVNGRHKHPHDWIQAKETLPNLEDLYHTEVVKSIEAARQKMQDAKT